MRRMMTVIFILGLFWGVLKAPCYPVVYIATAPEINYYQPLINAVTYVESCNGKYTYNAKEQAVGDFQIRQCRLDDYNAETGTKYVLTDMYNYELSRKVFLHYTKGRSFEAVSRAWAGGEAGTKEATNKYWKLVSAKL